MGNVSKAQRPKRPNSEFLSIPEANEMVGLPANSNQLRPAAFTMTDGGVWISKQQVSEWMVRNREWMEARP